MRKLLFWTLFCLFPLCSFSQITFTNDIAFFAYLKINKTNLTNDETQKYIKRYHKNELRKNATDEFELQNFINKKTVEYQNSIDTLDLSKHFMSDVMVKLGEYDFTNKGFPLIYDGNFSQGLINPAGGYTSYDYVCKAVNISKYTFLPMEPDKAKELLNQLKANGNSQRILLNIFKFALNGKTDKYFNDQISGLVYFTGYTLCEIVEMNIIIKGMGGLKLEK